MKKSVMLLFCAGILAVFASCSRNVTDTKGNNSSITPNANLTSSTSVQSEAGIDENTVSDSEKTSDSNETENGVGGEDFCMAHKFLYHSYSTQLLNYVGYENFQEWSKSMQGDPSKEMNIVTFVEHFQIPKETLIAVERATYTDDFAEYDGVTMLSLEQIDAIYSGDKKLINETFCGPLAFVNEADGELYSIYWLAEHTAEDYVAANLPAEKIEEVLLTAASEEYATDTISKLAESAGETLTSAIALEAELAAEIDESAASVTEGLETSVASDVAADSDVLDEASTLQEAAAE